MTEKPRTPGKARGKQPNRKKRFNSVPKNMVTKERLNNLDERLKIIEAEMKRNGTEESSGQ